MLEVGLVTDVEYTLAERGEEVVEGTGGTKSLDDVLLGSRAVDERLEESVLRRASAALSSACLIHLWVKSRRGPP